MLPDEPEKLSVTCLLQALPVRYWTISRAIERMVEQNHDQKYSYDREVLIEMLDAALAKQSGEAVQ